MARGGPPSAFLDRVVRPEISFRGRAISAFRFCGYVGLAFAVLLAMGLVVDQGRSWLVMGAIVLVAVATFLGLTMATKVVTGSETLVYYHHEIAVVTMTSLFLWVIGEPLLPYLDATILGVGAFLACGRIGCLMVGCCYGRPAGWGVAYGEAHAEVGFPPHLLGVRLVPIQVVESLWVVAVVAVGAAMVLTGRAPGSAFAWYVVAYDVGRFGFEFVRGDAARPYRWGFSTPQWLAVALTWAIVGAELAGFLPFRSWHVAAAVGLSLVCGAVALDRRWRRPVTYRLLQPRHVEEIAVALARAPAVTVPTDHAGWSSAATAALRIQPTSLGILISGGGVDTNAEWIEHYALSSRSGDLGGDAAGALASLILRLRQPDGVAELIEGTHGVFHLLLRPHRSQTDAARSEASLPAPQDSSPRRR
jgi:hypothetical protein